MCKSVFCVEIMQIHSVVLFVVRTMRKFDFKFVTKDTPNKMATSRKKLYCDRESGFYSIYSFSRTVFAGVKGFY
jgi:hypothetical protein